MQAQQIEFHKQRDFGNKLNATIEFIKQNFKILAKSLLYIAGPFVVIGSLLFVQVYSGFLRSIANESQLSHIEENLTSMVSFGVAGLLFLMVGSTFVIAVVNDFMILYEEKRGDKFDVSEIWNRVKSSFLPTLGTVILYALVLLTAYIIVIIPVVILGQVSSALMVLSVFVVLCLFIYIIIALTPIFIVRAYERISFGAALSRCFYLVKGKWWSTFGLVVVTSIIHNVVSSIFFIPWYINFILTTLHSTQSGTFEEPSLLSEILSNGSLLLYFIFSYLLYCIPLIAINFQYFNLVEKKEAKGLMSKIDAFDNEEKKDNDQEHY